MSNKRAREQVEYLRNQVYLKHRLKNDLMTVIHKLDRSKGLDSPGTSWNGVATERCSGTERAKTLAAFARRIVSYRDTVS